MKKFFAMAVCLLLLGGCARSMESDLPQTVQTFLEAQSSFSDSLGANRTKDYYKYYLPLDMGTRESTQLGEVFIKNDSIILMNFDPSSIIIHNYYSSDNEEEQPVIEEERQQAREDGRTETDDGGDTSQSDDSTNDADTGATTALQESDLSLVEMQIDDDMLTYSGTYKTNSQTYYPYKLYIAKSNGNYLLYLNGGVVEFYSLSPLANVMTDLKSMFLIMKSISFDTDDVLDNFSMKNATSSRQQSIDTLQQNLPSVGSIPDLLEQMEQLSGNR